ncbi:ribosomal protein S19 binding protein 1 [Ictalurus punctatus]|uniref:Active regulator of SIRT1 n=1 Tax=Ictalurus punctatus TaxID=7998 RepID=A0A2D0S1Z5_ICTPU|nr:ribosomal protein S19 binding protein 1 [Ictalurus punctatus]XP_053494777.1 ribosomal protein S19 binding protein 1 [Ictalurus furcatus]
MSISLLRRGLELLNEDLKGVAKGPKKKCTKKASVMDQISTNKQGVRKQLRRLQPHNTTRKNKATVKDKQIRNALEEYRKKQKKSQLNSNLQYFLGNSYKMQTSCTQKIVHQNVGRQSRHQPEKPVKKQEKQSIFTEAEFQKFQEEYFSNR